VYLGQHVRLNLQAAIKVLHTHLTAQEVAHFQQEAETIATLVHPSIVRVFDYDVQKGVPFLVMDYAPGGETIPEQGHAQLSSNTAVCPRFGMVSIGAYRYVGSFARTLHVSERFLQSGFLPVLLPMHDVYSDKRKPCANWLLPSAGRG
jgi:hypothetical protein